MNVDVVVTTKLFRRSIKDAILELNIPQGLTTGNVYDAIMYFLRFERYHPDPYSWRQGKQK